MLNFAVYFVGESGRNTQFLEDNFMEIMGIFFTLYISIVAFVYPKIIDTKEKIKNISQILINKLDKIWYIKYYLILIISILSIDFILFYLFKCQFWFILLNIIISVIILLMSCFVFKKLEKFLLKPTNFLESIDKFNFENEKDLEIVRENIYLCEDLLTDIINNKKIITKDFFKYLQIFELNSLNYLKSNSTKINKKNIINLLLYINNKIIYQKCDSDLYILFIKSFKNIINNLSEIHNYNYKYVVKQYTLAIIFAIQNRYLNFNIKANVRYLYKQLIKLQLDDTNNSIYNITYDLINNIINFCNNKEINILFVECFIEECVSKQYDLYSTEKINEEKLNKLYCYFINIVFKVYLILLKNKNYNLFKYIFNLISYKTNTEFNQTFIQPNCCSSIFTHIGKFKILNHNGIKFFESIDEYNKRYLYFLIVFIIIYNNNDINIENSLLVENDKEYNEIQEIEKKLKKNSYYNDMNDYNLKVIKEYFSDIIHIFIININMLFNQLFTNTEFCEVMNIDINKKEEYRKFIDEKLKELEEIVKSNE